MSVQSSGIWIPASSEYENVQFCPCGHDYRMLRAEIVERGGAKQLEEIDTGFKLDAVIFSSSNCGVCKDEADARDRRYAELDFGVIERLYPLNGD
jgi:hypothetical protein